MDPPRGPNGNPRHVGSPQGDILFDVEDLEEPLISVEAGHELETQGILDAVGSLEGSSKQIAWPALRRSSLSVRKISPVTGFDSNEASAYVFLPNSTLY